MNALFLAAAIAGSPAPDALKCGHLPNTFPGYDPAAPVVVVDDRVVPGAEGLEGIGALDVERVEVWNGSHGFRLNPTRRISGWRPAAPIRPD